jgi:fumarate hydratase class II
MSFHIGGNFGTSLKKRDMTYSHQRLKVVAIGVGTAVATGLDCHAAHHSWQVEIL